MKPTFVEVYFTSMNLIHYFNFHLNKMMSLQHQIKALISIHLITVVVAFVGLRTTIAAKSHDFLYSPMLFMCCCSFPVAFR